MNITRGQMVRNGGVNYVLVTSLLRKYVFIKHLVATCLG
jgi:hypothetical protein